MTKANMECCECRVLLCIDELRLIHPTRKEQLAGKYDAWTNEPDFFCKECSTELRLDDLPDLDKARWWNEVMVNP